MNPNALKFKKIIWKIVLIILAALMVFAIVHNIIKNKKTESQNQIKNVKVTQAKLGSIATTVDYPGELDIDKEISISPKSPGKIQSLNVKAGSSVKKDDILFTLDSTSLKAQLEQQQASVDSANANLNKTRSSGVEQPVLQAQQSLETAQINYNDAKTSYDRIQSLYSAGAAAKQDLDSASTKLKTSSAALSAAQQNLDLLKQKIGPESVEVAQAQVAQAEAGTKSIQSQIDDTTVRSPVSGVVSAVNIHEGEISPTTQPSVIILDLSSLIAKVNLPDNMLSKIKVGQSVDITIPSAKNKKITGTVDNIAADIDSKTQKYPVKIKINSSDGSLKPGMFSKISLADKKKDNILTIPNEAIKIENGVSYLYVVKNNKIRKISVDTGLSNDKRTEILSSKINSGDNIVSTGLTFLNEGDKVKILN